MKSTSVKFQMELRSPLKDAVEDWRFAHRLSSRNEAIRQLIELGLKHSAEQAARDAVFSRQEPSPTTLHEPGRGEG